MVDSGAAEGLPVRLVAGGTDLWPNLKRRAQKASTVVSLNGIAELRTLSREGERVAIGGTTTLAEIASSEDLAQLFPSVSAAARRISTPALRNMGTLGGNLCLDTRCNYYNQSEEWRRSVDYCMKEDGEVCWVAPSSSRCWAVSAGDLGPVLCSLGATTHLVSSEGERVVPVLALYRNDGIDYLKKRPEEILEWVELPPESSASACRSSFLKLRRRGAIDFSVLSVAAAVWFDGGGSVERCSVVLGSVSSAPLEVEAASEALVGGRLEEEEILEAARSCRQAATPLDNTDFAAQWRSKMVEVYAAEALRACSGNVSDIGL